MLSVNGTDRGEEAAVSIGEEVAWCASSALPRQVSLQPSSTYTQEMKIRKQEAALFCLCQAKLSITSIF